MPHFDLELYGVRPEDEGLHPFDERDKSWNESVFFDWVEDERNAGHIRIGRMPGEGRVWVWLHVLHDGEWIVLEHPHLPIDAVSGFDVCVPGLTVTRTVETPLAKLRVAQSTTRYRCGTQLTLGDQAVRLASRVRRHGPWQVARVEGLVRRLGFG